MARSTVTPITTGQTSGGELSRLTEAVDDLRASLGISYRDLAERVGIEHVRLYRMLKNQQRPDAYALGQAMIALGRHMDGRP